MTAKASHILALALIETVAMPSNSATHYAAGPKEPVYKYYRYIVQNSSPSYQKSTSDKTEIELTKFTINKEARRNSFAFTSQQIASDGASGIDQGFNPNCWFEAALAVLAELPRGQKLIAGMIKIADSKTYLVRFPGDGVEYRITEEELNKFATTDKALWAALLECAQVKKFPENDGSKDISVGLKCLTGRTTQSINPNDVSLQELSKFIQETVSSNNPVICVSKPSFQIANLPDLVVQFHTYSIVGFDSASGMITIRNPHGKHSIKYSLADDPNHRKFEWIGKGVFKMHISLFQKYFDEVCRSFI